MIVSAFVEQQTAYWVERFGYIVTAAEGPAFREAIQVLVEFLAEELGEHDWPLAVFCRDGDDGWAFALLAFDTVSYLRNGYVQWLGTTWEPGCECGEPLDDGSDVLGPADDHRADCPQRNQ